MDSVRVPLRKSFENQLVRAYLGFAPPKSAPNFLEHLPTKYHFAELPGFDEFCAAYELEYEQRRYDEAKKLYEISCGLGHPLANYCYGLWFLAGDRPSTEKDLKKAFQKFCHSHKFGLGQATYQLADYYRTGKGKVVGRDVKKSFAFLLQSVLDPRIHWLLDAVPFCLLGLAYGLGRGPSTVSISDAVRCLDRALRYAFYQQNNGINAAPTSMVDGDFSCLFQLAMLVAQWDVDELKRQVTVRVNALETYMDELPPGRAMMTLAEFSITAKTFGLDYDEYLATLGNAKGAKRVTWKSFRRQTDGRARALCVYQRQNEVEHPPPLEPDDAELQKFLSELEVCNTANRQDALEEGATDEDYGFRLFSNDYAGDLELTNGVGKEEGGEGETVAASETETDATKFGACISDFANEKLLDVTTGEVKYDGDVSVPKNEETKVIDEKENHIPESD